jgi:hypothetical protein
MDRVIKLVKQDVDLIPYGFSLDELGCWEYSIFVGKNIRLYASFDKEGVMELWVDNDNTYLPSIYLNEQETNEMFAITEVVDFPAIVLDLFVKGIVVVDYKQESVSN